VTISALFIGGERGLRLELYTAEREPLVICCLPTYEDTVSVLDHIIEASSTFMVVNHRLLPLMPCPSSKTLDKTQKEWQIGGSGGGGVDVVRCIPMALH
jgi:hypothetical protein